MQREFVRYVAEMIKYIREILVEDYGYTVKGARNKINSSRIKSVMLDPVAKIRVLHYDVYYWAEDLVNGEFDK